MSKTSKEQTRKLAIFSLLTAITIAISFVTVAIPGGFEITLSLIPVSIGAMLYGPWAGALLGGVFGLTSFFQCFGFSSLGAALLDENPFFAFLVCFPTRVLTGLLTGVIYAFLSRIFKKSNAPFLVGSLAGPILNTVFFMTALMLLFMKGTTIQGAMNKIDVFNPFMFVFAWVGLNSLIEIVCGALVAFPCVKAVRRYLDSL